MPALMKRCFTNANRSPLHNLKKYLAKRNTDSCSKNRDSWKRLQVRQHSYLTRTSAPRSPQKLRPKRPLEETKYDETDNPDHWTSTPELRAPDETLCHESRARAEVQRNNSHPEVRRAHETAYRCCHRSCYTGRCSVE